MSKVWVIEKPRRRLLVIVTYHIVIPEEKWRKIYDMIYEIRDAFANIAESADVSLSAGDLLEE